MQKYVLKNIERPSQVIIEEFRQLDVSTVYEAQGKLGLLNHEFRPIIEGSNIVGPAVTVLVPAGDNLMVHAAIEVCKPGDILVISTIGESKNGMTGELIVTALMKRGVQGIITEGAVRDVVHLRKLGFPAWSRAIYSQGQTKSKGGWVNAPIVCGGVRVNPGDLIMADDDGVVVVDKNNLEFALHAAKDRIEKEKATREKINRGELSLDFYNLRLTLEKEHVVYYDNEDEVAK